MSPVLQYQLLQEEECPLMKNLLSDLNTGPPHVGRVRLGAFGTLLCGDDVDDLEALL